MGYRSKDQKLFSGDGAAHRRAIYKGCGYDDIDLSRPLIGVVNTCNDAALGHVHLDKLAEHVKAGIWQAGRNFPADLRPGRFSAFTEGSAIGHVAPEAAVGGPIAIVEEGDPVMIDIPARKLDLDISEEEISRRLKDWSPPPAKVKRGILAIYAKTALQAHEGAMIDDRLKKK